MPEIDTSLPLTAQAPPARVSTPAPVPEAFPVPLARFLPTLRRTHDEVWSKLLKNTHGREKHTMAEWASLLASHKGA